MTYEQLDFIADTYVPLLFIICLAIIAVEIKKYGFVQTVPKLGNLVLSIVTVYLLMFLDIYLNIWPQLGLDYSTHTALALALVTFISFQSKKFCVLAGSSLCFYILLMMYQQYHTLSDIISTAIILGPIFVVYHRLLPGKK